MLCTAPCKIIKFPWNLAKFGHIRPIWREKNCFHTLVVYSKSISMSGMLFAKLSGSTWLKLHMSKRGQSASRLFITGSSGKYNTCWWSRLRKQWSHGLLNKMIFYVWLVYFKNTESFVIIWINSVFISLLDSTVHVFYVLELNFCRECHGTGIAWLFRDR